MKKKYNQKIDGTYREPNIKNLPKYAGVYFVYEGRYNEEKKSITPIKLIYIGEAENINERVTGGHEHYNDWKKEVNKENVLCFSYTEVEDNNIKEGSNRKRIEAAYIVHHQPPVNVKHKESFNYGETVIESSSVWDNIGSSYIDMSFTVINFSNY